jgi:hypothetical protein
LLLVELRLLRRTGERKGGKKKERRKENGKGKKQGKGEQKKRKMVKIGFLRRLSS